MNNTVAEEFYKHATGYKKTNKKNKEMNNNKKKKICNLSTLKCNELIRTVQK